jgi:tetratricopeptide (TPR) repeat protein
VRPPPTPARLRSGELFAAVAEEALRDGRIEEFEERTLRSLAGFLRLTPEQASSLMGDVRRRFEAGALGPARRMDPVRLLREVFHQVVRDGVREPREEQLLAFLGRSLGLPRTALEAFEAAWHASVLRRTGRLAEAEQEARRALTILETNLSPEHPEVGVQRGNLAGIISESGRHPEAIELAVRAREAVLAGLGREHHDHAIACNNLARYLERAGRNQEAEGLRREALEVALIAWGPDSVHTARAQVDLGMLLLSLERPGEALEEVRAGAGTAARLLGSADAALTPWHQAHRRAAAAAGADAELEAIDEKLDALRLPESAHS